MGTNFDRLTDVAYHDSDSEAFVMDGLGNRTGNQTLREDGAVNFTVDSGTNRYTAIGGHSISHDEAGNLTIDKDGYQYTYDYENRVVKIEDVNDVDVATYAYDALGRRIKMIDSIASTITLYYYNPDWQVLAEYDGANSLQRYFVYGNYIDEPLIMHRQSDGEDYYYGQDHLYSTVVLLDDSGNVVERYEYDAYGTTHIMDASYNSRSASSYGSPYTFTGRRLDVLDSSVLVRMHYRHRDYDVYAGRFLQQDLRGITPSQGTTNAFEVHAQYDDGPSLYQYARSDPAAGHDPYGLSTDLEPYYKCTEAPPTDDLSVCDVHGADRIDKVGLSWGARCVCRCAGDTDWDNQVRGCLACAKAKDLDMELAHEICYADADAKHGEIEGAVARLDVAFRCSYCTLPDFYRLRNRYREICDDFGL